MFNRRMLAAGAVSAALAASGVLGTAVSASAAPLPGPAGPVTTVPNQPVSGQPGTAIAKPTQNLVQTMMTVLSGGSPQPGQMQPLQQPAQP